MLRELGIFCFCLILGITIAKFGILSLAAFFLLVCFLAAAFLIFKNPLIGLVLVAFFLPFEKIGGVHLAGINIRISQVLAIITLLAWVIVSLERKKFVIRFPAPFVILILFLASNLVSIIFSLDINRAIAVFAFTVLVFLVALLVTNLVKGSCDFEKIILALFLGAGATSLFGIYQFVGDMIGLPQTLTLLSDRYIKDVLGFARVQSTAIEPLYFANFLLVPLGLMMVLILNRVGRIKNWFLVATFFISFIAFSLTFSKGGFLALGMVVLAIMLFQLRFLFRRQNLPFLLGIILLLSIFAGTIIYASGRVADFEKLVAKTIGIITGASIAERLDASTKAIEAVASSPFFGIGPGNFGPFFAGFVSNPPDGGWAIVNNEYLELLAETGIIGTLLFIAFLVAVFLRSYKILRENQNRFGRALILGLSIGLFGILVQYLSFSTLYITHIWFFFGLLIAAQEWLLNKNQEESEC